jgi:hypothetical protein
MSNAGQDFQCLVDLPAGVLAGHDGANAGFALGNGWEGDAGGHETSVEESFAEVHRLASVTDDDRRDGRFALWGGFAADVETGVGELLLEVVSVGPEALDALRLGLENVEGCNAGSRDRWRVRGGEEEWPSAVIEIVDEIARAADVAAECSNSFGQRAYLHIDALRAVKMIHTAATIAAENPGGVGIIDHHDGTVLVGDIAELVDGADVAVHRKDAVGDEELAARLVLYLFQQLFGVCHILMAKDFDFGAGEARAIDDAGVIQLIGEDEVFFAKDAGDSTCIRGEARLKNDACLDAFESRDFFFELHVNAHGAGDGANRS